MILRAVVVWIGILILAVLNGGVRDTWLVPALGDTLGRALSTISLSALVLLMSWFSIDWLCPRSNSGAWGIGLLWVALTLAFEFLAGHYLFKKSWAELLADYDLTRGRIWLVVLVVLLFAPLWSMRLRMKPGRYSALRSAVPP